MPKLARLLPERAVDTMAHGVELDALSETLDARVAEHLRGRIDAASYCAAYVAAGTRAEREQQERGEAKQTHGTTPRVADEVVDQRPAAWSASRRLSGATRSTSRTPSARAATSGGACQA